MVRLFSPQVPKNDLIIIIALIALGIGGFLFYSGKINLSQKQLVRQFSHDTPEKIVEDYYRN